MATRKKRKHRGKGAYCITTTRKRTKSAKTGRGGLSFSTVCYGSASKQYDALTKRAKVGGMGKGVYTIMLHKRARGR